MTMYAKMAYQCTRKPLSILSNTLSALVSLLITGKN